ncbi:histidine triad nucleotide-binding protein 3 isoform X2 [Folsomia candida]|nr:histidine triad nucleotide-binding protein 3 isoform X2 [Folsomia candida]XP_035702827.1 histidine triad nucleotide-binding protein 3 isoform X2 [Folsomia candida]
MPNIPSIPSIPSMPKGLPSIPTKADFMGPVDRDKCTFCRIFDGKESNPIIFQDEEIVVFEDIKPATKHHFLVVTNEHIRDAKAMVSSQIRILDRMIEVANQVLAEKLNQDAGIGDPTQVQRLLGFHWPPFHMVNHLHLHVLAPADQMGFFARNMFRPNSMWFVSPDYVRDRLMQMKSTEEAGAGNAINSQPDQ